MYILEVLYTRKIVDVASSISAQESLPSCLQRNTAHQKHGTSLFCNIPEILYKVIESIPIQCRPFQYIGYTWSQVYICSKIFYLSG